MKKLVVVGFITALTLTACGSSETTLQLPSSMPTPTSPTGNEAVTPQPETETETEVDTAENAMTEEIAKKSGKVANINKETLVKYGPVGSISDQAYVETLLDSAGSIPQIDAVSGFTSKEASMAVKTALAAATMAKNNSLSTINLLEASAEDIGDEAVAQLTIFSTQNFVPKLYSMASGVKDNYKTDTGNKSTKAFWRWMPVGMCTNVTVVENSSCVGERTGLKVQSIEPFSDGNVKGVKATIWESYPITTFLGNISDKNIASGVMENTAVYTIIQNPDPTSEMKWLIADISFKQFYTNLIPKQGEKE